MRVVTDLVTFEYLLDNVTCNTRFANVNLVGRTGCYDEVGQRPFYCHSLLAGGLDRGTLLLPSSVTGSAAPAAHGAINVLWHFRTGDVTVPLLNASFQRVKHILDAGLSRRGIVHRAMTERGAGALHRFFPYLKESGV